MLHNILPLNDIYCCRACPNSSWTFRKYFLAHCAYSRWQIKKIWIKSWRNMQMLPEKGTVSHWSHPPTWKWCSSIKRFFFRRCDVCSCRQQETGGKWNGTSSTGDIRKDRMTGVWRASYRQKPALLDAWHSEDRTLPRTVERLSGQLVLKWRDDSL